MQKNRSHILTRTLFAVFAAGAMWGAQATTATAQGLFQPVVFVNDKAVTQFELDQRVLLLDTLNTAGDLEEIALDSLINERVQLDVTDQFGYELTDEDIANGVNEFASRTDTTGPELLDQLAGLGIDPQSFRDFVIASLSWRELVQDKFGSLSLVLENDIALAKAQIDPRKNAQVLLSEIFLPANTPEAAAQSAEFAARIREITSFDEFSEAASALSLGQSREVGGRVADWVPLSNLPPPIAAMLLSMKPGQVTEPIPLPDAIAMFQLRGLREGRTSAASSVLDYATYYIAGGRSEAALQRAARLRVQVDSCDDLYGVAKGEPASVLERVTLPQSQVARDIALELAKLDANEISTNLTRANGQTLVFLMLCSRVPQVNAELSDDDIKQALVNKRLASHASTYLAQLRADAIIRYP